LSEKNRYLGGGESPLKATGMLKKVGTGHSHRNHSRKKIPGKKKEKKTVTVGKKNRKRCGLLWVKRRDPNG